MAYAPINTGSDLAQIFAAAMISIMLEVDRRPTCAIAHSVQRRAANLAYILLRSLRRSWRELQVIAPDDRWLNQTFEKP